MTESPCYAMLNAYGQRAPTFARARALARRAARISGHPTVVMRPGSRVAWAIRPWGHVPHCKRLSPIVRAKPVRDFRRSILAETGNHAIRIKSILRYASIVRRQEDRHFELGRMPGYRVSVALDEDEQ